MLLLFFIGRSLAVVDAASRCAVLMFHDEQLIVIPFKQGIVTNNNKTTAEMNDKENGITSSTTIATPKVGKSRLRRARSSKFSIPLTGRYSSLIMEPYVLPLRDVGPKTGIRQTAVADICLLEGFHEPVLCILQEAPMRTWSGSLNFHNHTYRIFASSLNLIQRRHPCIWDFEGLPHDCYRMDPVPAPHGGCLVHSNNAILYFSQNRRCGVALNGFAYGSVNRKVCPVHVPRLRYNFTLDGSRKLSIFCSFRTYCCKKIFFGPRSQVPGPALATGIEAPELKLRNCGAASTTTL